MSCTTCMRIMIYKNSFSNWFCDLQFIERYKKDYKKGMDKWDGFSRRTFHLGITVK